MPPIRRVCHLLLIALLAAHLCLPALPCPADIYRWQDEQGHWHFSDSPPSDAPLQQPPDAAYEAPASPSSAPLERDAQPPVSSPSDASMPAPADAVEKTPLQGGLLWRVAKHGTAPSHLLGTIHSADPRVVRLRPAVQNALDRSDRFVMEMEMDSAVMTDFGASMLLTDGSDLESLLGATLYSQVIGAMTDFGLPEMAVRNLKPWAVMALLSMPKPSPEPILDLVLREHAVTAGKPTAGLETAQEQLAVFDGLSIPDQISLLKMTLAHLPALPRMFDQLVQAYAADDLKSIADLAEEYQRGGDTGAVQRFTLRLNDERNHRMVARMAPYLEQGSSFIAVGALHLAGPAGLLQLLRTNGYTVTSIR
jgi:uncharacterized protein YbaP (TraB family)